MLIAYQGEAGAYSEAAVGGLFPEATPLPCPTFEAVFEAVEGGVAARGVVPIENSLFGSVHANYDLLLAHTLHVVGELHLRVRHCLLARPGTTLAGVQRVTSHPQALGQCQAFLKQHLPGAAVVPAYDTAGAAKLLAEGGDARTAAIASRRAGEVYGLAVLAEGIETNAQNYTRFLVLAPEPAVPPAGADAKTSLAFTFRANVPGALFKSLAVFALRELDLLKIESRPRVGSPGQYYIHLDVAGSQADEPVRRALDHLAEFTAALRVLGSYPKGRTA